MKNRRKTGARALQTRLAVLIVIRLDGVDHPFQVLSVHDVLKGMKGRHVLLLTWAVELVARSPATAVVFVHDVMNLARRRAGESKPAHLGYSMEGTRSGQHICTCPNICTSLKPTEINRYW